MADEEVNEEITDEETPGKPSIHRVLKVYIGSELVYSAGKRVVQESEESNSGEGE